MAGTPSGLIAGRAALLLRCQESRERRQRIEAAQATRRRSGCAAALASAQAIRLAHEQSRQHEMHRVYTEMAGRQVDVGTLQALPATERLDRAQAAAYAKTCADAECRLHEAAGVEAAALLSLAQAARATRRREHLAEATVRIHRRELDGVDEAVREDATTEAWRAAA